MQEPLKGRREGSEYLGRLEIRPDSGADLVDEFVQLILTHSSRSSAARYSRVDYNNLNVQSRMTLGGVRKPTAGASRIPPISNAHWRRPPAVEGD
jgi:hypothetical protein